MLEVICELYNSTAHDCTERNGLLGYALDIFIFIDTYNPFTLKFKTVYLLSVSLSH